MRTWAVLIAVADTQRRAQLMALLRTSLPVSAFYEATTAEEAVEMCCAIPPGLVLIDSHLPQMGGFSAAHHIKTNCPEMVVIMIIPEDAESYRLAAAISQAERWILRERLPHDLGPVVQKCWQKLET